MLSRCKIKISVLALQEKKGITISGNNKEHRTNKIKSAT